MNRAGIFSVQKISAFLVALSLTFGNFGATLVFASTTVGPVSPSSVVNDASSGDVDWGNTSNATSTNGLVASVVSPKKLTNGNPTSQLIRVSGFDFSSIPNGATIEGVTASVVRKGTASNTDLTVKLVTNTATSSNKASATAWPTSLTATTYGGTSDVWGLTLTPTIVKSASFGLIFAVQHTGGGNSNPEVDSILLSITYSVTPDVTGPVISGTPSDMTVEATSVSGASVSYTSPTATDAVDGSVAVSCLPASGSTFAIGTTLVTCSAQDLSNNTSQTTFNITVQDTTAPAIASHVSITEEATSPTGNNVTYTSPVTTDAVDGASVANCTPASATLFGFGTTTVNCSATDVHGNATTSSFTITVQDTTAPVISIAGANPLNLLTTDTFSDPGATANDSIDGVVTVSAIDNVSTSTPGVYSVSYTATDSHGNTAQASRTVNVSGVDGPVFSNTPSDMTVEATSASGEVVSYTSPDANDVIDGPTAVICTPTSGSTFPIGTTAVTCSSQDLSSNTSFYGFSITVTDTTAPIVTIAPLSQTLEATSTTGSSASFTTSANDIVDGNIAIVSCDQTSGAMFALGTTTITCSATDAHNNTGSSTATVTVRDTTAPTITAPVDQTFVSTGALTTPTLVMATTTDLVDVAPVVTYDIHDFAVGTTTVTWTATDDSGNFATTSSRVEITAAPVPVVTPPVVVTPTPSGGGGGGGIVSGPSSFGFQNGGNLAAATVPNQNNTSAGAATAPEVTGGNTGTAGNVVGQGGTIPEGTGTENTPENINPLVASVSEGIENALGSSTENNPNVAAAASGSSLPKWLAGILIVLGLGGLGWWAYSRRIV